MAFQMHIFSSYSYSDSFCNCSRLKVAKMTDAAEQNSETILLVDDNTEIHTLFRSVIARQQLSLVCVSSGFQAKNVLRDQKIELVILDVVLQEENGLNLLKEIRTQSSIEQLPVIMLSGHSDPAYILEALELGASDFLVKSLGIAVLFQRIKMHLRIHRGLQTLRQLEERNRNILLHIPDLIFRVNAAGEVLDLNRSPEGMLLQIFEGLHGSTSKLLLGPEVKAAAMEFVNEPHAKGAVAVRRVSSIDMASKKLARCFELRMVACDDLDAICMVRDITALEQKEQELLQLIGTDPLTKIANRRRFTEDLEREWRRQLREQTPLSLILIDVDFFKHFNDTAGHVEGDKCLINVAATIEQSCKRPGDFAARFGGEEFAAILPNTDATGAAKVAERIRASVEEMQIPNSKVETVNRLTVSVGYASLVPGRGSTYEELIVKADKALYKSKRNGRNKVSEFKDTDFAEQ